MPTESIASDPVLYEKRGRVALLTLNRPEKLNAWSGEMSRMVVSYIEQANIDDEIGAIIITGNGRGFSSGADLQRDRNAVVERRFEPESFPSFLQRSKPLIAAINGPAVGIGLTLSLCCDVRIASDAARLSARFVRIALTPELGSSFFLPQIVGLGNAAELILTGRIVDAAEAYRLGLVNRVVPHEDLLDAAFALAEEIAFNPPQQVEWAKQLLYANAANDNLRAVVQAEEVIFAQALKTPAFAEAGKAFAEKRQPNFNP